MKKKRRLIVHLVEGASLVALHSFSSFASNSLPTRRDLSNVCEGVNRGFRIRYPTILTLKCSNASDIIT